MHETFGTKIQIKGTKLEPKKIKEKNMDFEGIPGVQV